MAAGIRTFIAFDLSGEARGAIKKIQGNLKSKGLPVRWVATANIHLTLKFIGEVPAEAVQGLAAATGEMIASRGPIQLAIQGLGVFPGIRRPRVIWAGLGGDTAALFAFQAQLEEKLHQLGYPKEKRGFKAHLTLGRTKGRLDSKRLLRVLDTCSQFEEVPFEASRLVLYRSELTSGGARYTPLAGGQLGGGGQFEGSPLGTGVNR
jgi:2'-5' RNA ligase